MFLHFLPDDSSESFAMLVKLTGASTVAAAIILKTSPWQVVMASATVLGLYCAFLALAPISSALGAAGKRVIDRWASD